MRGDRVRGHSQFAYADGRTLLCVQWSNRDKIGDLMAGCVEEDQRPMALLTTHASEVLPRLSPSGEVVAFPKLKLSAAPWNRGTLEGHQRSLALVAIPGIPRRWHHELPFARRQ